MKAEDFISILKENGINDFTGVPCSVFKEVIAYLEGNQNYVIASNEGEAMGIAAGISLSGKLPAVFMQNDGFANALNPIMSLQKLYELPTLLVISWRGEPGKKDAPQHKWSGKTLLDFLHILDIDSMILPSDLKEGINGIKKIIRKVQEENRVGALICRKGIFEKKPTHHHLTNDQLLSREEAIGIILQSIDGDTQIFSTTGKVSREIYKLKDRNNNFYVMGSMGCASSIALGFNMKNKSKTVVFDGDGAILMHMGNLATIGYYQPEKFLHICLDNESYESTGGQTAVSKSIHLSKIAVESRYSQVARVKTNDEIHQFLQEWNQNPQLSFLHIKVKNKTDDNLGRPKENPSVLKDRFMRSIK